MNKEYDIAVLGGGLAGLSVLYHLIKAGKLEGKKALLVDPEGRKSAHDRTWSFWETEPGPFEAQVFHRWHEVTVHDRDRDLNCKLHPYVYKLIRSSEFYAHVNMVIDDSGAVTRIEQVASDVEGHSDKVTFRVGEEAYQVNHAFSSIPLHLRPRQIKEPYLDQHFRGWYVKTEEEIFDPGVAALMDFRTPQENETRFLYVLPFSKTEAVVEIAIFSNVHLKMEEYDRLIGNYIKEHWTVQPYTIEHYENGNIPMTTYPFPRWDGNLIYIGLRGGAARPSTGYTFYGLQRQLVELADSFPATPPKPWRNRDIMYDATILRILQDNRLPGDQVFTDLFQRNPTPRLLSFLNGESTVGQELALMSTTNIAQFGRSFVSEIFN
ncbi:lycopene cyclase family protein [Neolewinella antarctica]|uniref:Lycopene beta-cyclase n=1 Tax=Neolewinella antarctica TaxID=442734 RepID=A0ABX0XDU8_9BACT|nr:lycopene cyclase family protein [Neolewinella antarctica]NJC27387.1 lycopene beta-cyclase [Neolewinella antarctica]